METCVCWYDRVTLTTLVTRAQSLVTYVTDLNFDDL